MANDKKFIVKNGLQTPNVSFKDSNESLNEITVEMLGTDTLSFSGDAGQLFSLTDTLSGTIFSVNDISGIPSIEVDDDGEIRLAEFAGNVSIGTDSSRGFNVYVDGDLSADSATFTNITRTGTTVVAGTYGSQTAIPVVTVDASGFVDSIGTEALSTVLNTSAETGTGSVNLLDSSLEIAAGVGIDTVASSNTVTVEIDSADLAAYFSKVIVHDNTNGFVADEHVAHSGVNITAGSGLTGGGNIASSRTLNVGEGTGITVAADTVSTNDAEIVHDNLSGFVADEHVAHSSISINANNGLTGGGTIDANVGLSVGAGVGIRVNADDVEIDSADLAAYYSKVINHDNTSGFVADEHVAHSGVNITAGSGLTGGGNIASSRTLNIGEGTGITVSADAVSTNDAEIVHDNLSGFVADEHVAHSGVTLTAGNGLTGGGTIAASRSFAVGEGTGITVAADTVSTNDAEIVHDNLSGFVADEHIDHSGVSITAGKGLTGGGNITTSRVIDIDSANVRGMFSGGTGITYNSGTGVFTTTDGEIVHDNLSGFVANEHINHSSVSITAGDGLTGGGNITSTRTLNVVGGDGITANADEIEVTVDNSTIELSATDGSGAVRVKDGGITNAKLQNSSLTVGSTNIALGATSTTLAGLTQVTAGQVNVDNVRIDGNTISTTGGSYMYIDPHPTDSAGTLVILGNLQVDGETTTIQSSTVTISDKNIVLADSATTNAQANGAGITVNGSNATITYDGSTDRWDFNKPIEVSTVHGALSGNASTASALSSAVTVELSGDVSGSATFTNAGSTATISTTIEPNSVALGTDTTGNYVASLVAGNLIDLQNNSGENATPTIDVDLSELTDMTDAAVGADELVILDAGVQKRKAINEITLGLFNTANQIALGTDTTGSYVQQGATSGNGISGSVNSEGGTFTVTSNATNANTPSTIVFRDGSGNFSAGTITATLSGNATTATNATNSTNANNVNINDTTENSTHYVHFGDATTGYDGVKVSSSKLTFNPSSGVLSVNGVSVATTADLTAASSPNFSVDSANFGTANSFSIGEGKAVYYDTTTSKWEGAYNDSTGEYTASHVIVDMTTTDVKIASTGIFTIGMSGMSADNYYFLSSTAGTTTNDPDSSPTAWQPLYYALDANTIDLQVQTPEDTVITTFGSDGTIQEQGGGINNVVEDTTPQLGGNLDLNSQNITGTGNINIAGNVDLTAATTESRNIEIGKNRTGDGYAFIDLIGDATYTDYGFRIIRNNTGANTTSDISHRGTGDLRIAAIDAGSIKLKTSNTDRVTITSGGLVGIGNSSPSTELDVTGDITASGTIQDAQGNVRALERTVISSTPYNFPASSSGKYFVCNVNSLTINIDGADISLGDIFTIWSFPTNGDVTISWTNMTNGVYIAGDTNNKGTSGSITLAAGGLCTVICDTNTRMVVNGNVS